MFRVEWLQTALDELTTVWLDADSALRQAITTASHQLEEELKTDPEGRGESRDTGKRVHFAPPMTVIYVVDAEQQVVTIAHIRLFKRRI